ncbi:DUF4156 domain-containing protein [Shigella sonnei]
MAGCSSSNELSAAGQSVRIVDHNQVQSASSLVPTGKQSNWLSGQHGEEGGSMRGAANDLRNQRLRWAVRDLWRQQPVAGNVFQFVPTDSQIIGTGCQVPELMDPEAGTSSLVVKQM